MGKEFLHSSVLRLRFLQPYVLLRNATKCKWFFDHNTVGFLWLLFYFTKLLFGLRFSLSFVKMYKMKGELDIYEKN